MASFHTDITGQTFSHLTALNPTEQRQDGSVVWRWRCSCGKEILRSVRNVRYTVINRGNIASCGCVSAGGNKSKYDLEGMIGTTFGKLTALSICKVRNTRYILCRCTCGKEFPVMPCELAKGGRTSCGQSCRISRPKLPEGEGSMHGVYAALRYFARINNIHFDLTYEEFDRLSQMDCDHCYAAPSTAWDSHTKNNRNGVYVHNKVHYIDKDLGYTADNIIVLCINCSHSRRATIRNNTVRSSSYASRNNADMHETHS